MHAAHPDISSTSPVTARARPPIEAMDFERQPFILAWELTRACNLACVHCRADAQIRRHPLELSTEEALAVIDQVARFDIPPILVFTGGDPMRRPDIIDLIHAASLKGIRATLTPAGTPLASFRRLQEARDAGLSRIAVSLDGTTPAEHDSFRSVVGSFTWTLDIIEHAHLLGLEVQIHSTLCRRTLGILPRMADIVEELGAMLWAVFCLAPIGRAGREDELTATEYEMAFSWLYDRSQTATWQLKLTEGYHYRRVVEQRAGESHVATSGPARIRHAIGRAPFPVNAGNGFCFISHVGEICPSGFLPIVTGNVRDDALIETYRSHPVFRRLRDPSLLKGRCGACEFRERCGGSRSRAYAHTGDYLEADPACAYDPQPHEHPPARFHREQ